LRNFFLAETHLFKENNMSMWNRVPNRVYRNLEMIAEILIVTPPGGEVLEQQPHGAGEW